MIWLLSSVKSKMCLQVSFLIESFPTVFKWTNIVFHSIVLLDMDIEPLDTTVRLVASLDWTLVSFDCSMCLKMILQMAFRHEVLLATRVTTLERPEVLI